MLSDGDITRAEYVEASQRYVNCAGERGVAVTAIENFGLFQYQVANPTEEQDRVLDECSIGTTYNVEPFYGELLTNPNREDPLKIRVQCLVDSGLAPEGYTLEDYRADTPDGENARFPFDDADPRMAQCMANPQSMK